MKTLMISDLVYAQLKILVETASLEPSDETRINLLRDVATLATEIYNKELHVWMSAKEARVLGKGLGSRILNSIVGPESPWS